MSRTWALVGSRSFRAAVMLGLVALGALMFGGETLKGQTPDAASVWGRVLDQSRKWVSTRKIGIAAAGFGKAWPSVRRAMADGAVLWGQRFCCWC